jgi:hypothetical protein
MTDSEVTDDGVDGGPHYSLLVMQQNALQQLQKVTSRWREEKEKLMEAIDQERESFEDEKAVLRRELQSVTEELTQRTTRLAAAEKELFRLRHTAVVPSTASDGGGRAVSGPSVVAHVLLRRLWFKWRQSSLLRVQAAVLCVVAALALALWAQRSDWVTSHVTACHAWCRRSSKPSRRLAGSCCQARSRTQAGCATAPSSALAVSVTPLALRPSVQAATPLEVAVRASSLRAVRASGALPVHTRTIWVVVVAVVVVPAAAVAVALLLVRRECAGAQQAGRRSSARYVARNCGVCCCTARNISIVV